MMLPKKLLSGLLVLLSLPVTLVQAHNFQDVRNQDWFAAYVDQLDTGGIINTEVRNFYPNRTITRAELAKMAVKSAQYKGKLPIAIVSTDKVFCDIATSDWVHEFAALLVSKGINGISDNCTQGKKFLPNQSVTRAEALKMLFLLYGVNVSGSSTFKDIAQNAWYSSYVATAARLGLVNGYQDGTFRPNGLLTRAEMSKVVSHLMDTASSLPSTIPTPTALPAQTVGDTGSFTLPSMNTPHGSHQVAVSTEAQLREAIGNAQPGDEIILAAGTYRLSQQLWIDKQGTANNPIIIRSAGDKYSAKLTGSPEEGINIGEGSAYIVIDGLEVYGMGDNNIHVQNAHNITLQNIKSHDAGSDGDVIKVNQANHIVVQNNELARSGARPGCPGENCWQELIDFVDTDDSTIRDNMMTDFGNLAGYVKGGSTNVEITGNTISGQRSGAGDPAWGIGGWTDSELLRGRQYEAINVRFEENILTNNQYGALGIYDASNVRIQNNTFNNNHGVLIEFRAGNAPKASSDNITITTNRFNNNSLNTNGLCLISSHNTSNIAISNNTGNTTSAVTATSCLRN